MSRIPLWLDCDPGHDDAFAILVAAHHPSLKLVGISTVHGNASLEQTTRNALSILTAIERTDVPVYLGATKPFCREAQHAADIHGATGLDGTSHLPEPAVKPVEKLPAVLAMRNALLAEPQGTVWLVATGALTNVALLFAAFPELAYHIKGLSIMGGAIGNTFTDAPMGKIGSKGEWFGNRTPWAEFNIYCDPESAQAIFTNTELAAKTTLIPLDLTHQVLASAEVQHRILRDTTAPPLQSQRSSSIRPLYFDLLVFFAKTYRDVFDLVDGPPLHDPIAVVLLLENLVEMGASTPVTFDDRGGERWHVSVVTDGIHSSIPAEEGEIGRTIATRVLDGQPGVRIPRGMDVQRFWNVIEQCISRAEEHILAS